MVVFLKKDFSSKSRSKDEGLIRNYPSLKFSYKPSLTEMTWTRGQTLGLFVSYEYLLFVYSESVHCVSSSKMFASSVGFR